MIIILFIAQLDFLWLPGIITGMLYDFAALPFTRQPSRYSSRKFPLHALTVLSGHCKETDAAYCNDCAAQEEPPYAVWQYTIDGMGRIDLKKGSQDLRPGSLMVVPVPGPRVYYLPPDSGAWEFAFLVLIGREAVRITRMIEYRLGNVIDTGGFEETAALFYEMLAKLFAETISDAFSNSWHTYRLCMTLLRESGSRAVSARKPPFAELTAFLKANLHRDVSVDEMVSVSGFSRSYFSRLFSSEMGMSPRMYLEDLRLKAAMEFLFKEQISVKETAFRVGIPDVNYFCRIFKKRCGISPGKYKDRITSSE